MSGEKFESLIDEIGGSQGRIAGAVELHGAVALVIAGFEDSERSCQVRVKKLPFFISFHGLHVTDAVGVFEHRLDAFVGVFRLASGQSIRKIRVCVQPRAVHFFDDADDEEGVLADGIVVFEIYNDVFCGAVLRHPEKRIRSAIHVGFRILDWRHIGAHAWRTDGRGNVNPLFAEGDTLFALGFIQSVGTVLTVDGNVDDGAARFFDKRAKFI